MRASQDVLGSEHLLPPPPTQVESVRVVAPVSAAALLLVCCAHCPVAPRLCDVHCYVNLESLPTTELQAACWSVY